MFSSHCNHCVPLFFYLLLVIKLVKALEYANSSILLEYSSILTTGCIYMSNYCKCLPKQECYDPKKVDILLAYMPNTWFAQQSNLGNYSCPTTNCLSFVRANKQVPYHGYLMLASYGTDDAGKDDPRQININLELENNDDSNYAGEKSPFYDLYTSFRRRKLVNLWIPMSYISTDISNFKTKGLPFSMRTSNISVFVSNVNVVSRNAIINELADLYPMLSFGQFSSATLPSSSNEMGKFFPKCVTQVKFSPMFDAVKECIYFESKFSLSLENSVGVGYMTEKIWQPLKMGAIPIVLAKKYVQPNLPNPSAAIFIDDFPDIKSLAAYLHKVANDEVLWNHHVAWKDMPISSWSSKFKRLVYNSYGNSPCLLCEAVKQLYYSEFSFEKMISPHTCIYDIFVQEWVEPSHYLDYRHPPSHNISYQKSGGVLLDETAVKPLHDSLHSVRSPFNTTANGSIDHIYVIHYPDLNDNLSMENIKRILKAIFHTASITVMDLYEPRWIDSETIKCFVSADITLPVHSLSSALKHLYVYYHMLVAGSNRVLIVDDKSATSTFLHNAAMRWQEVSASSTLPTYDAVFFSGVDPSKRSDDSSAHGVHVHLRRMKPFPAAYLVSREGAMKLLKALPLNSSILHHMHSTNITILQYEV